MIWAYHLCKGFIIGIFLKIDLVLVFILIPSLFLLSLDLMFMPILFGVRSNWLENLQLSLQTDLFSSVSYVCLITVVSNLLYNLSISSIV